MRKKRHTYTQANVKLFLCFIKHNTMKPFGRSKAELQTSTSETVRWVPSESDRFIAGKDLPSAQSKKKGRVNPKVVINAVVKTNTPPPSRY